MKALPLYKNVSICVSFGIVCPWSVAKVLHSLHLVLLEKATHQAKRSQRRSSQVHSHYTTLSIFLFPWAIKCTAQLAGH